MIPLSPMLLGVVDEPFTREGWIAEVKWDGYRVLCEVTTERVQVWTRHGREIAGHHPELDGLRDLVREPVLFDGELCVIGDDGKPLFKKMRSRSHPHTLVAFDVLRIADASLLDHEWQHRRAVLERVVRREDDRLLVSRPFDDGCALFAECESRDVEGIVLKKKSSLYRPGRTREWLKCKTTYGKKITVERMRQSRTR